ncbi:MAG: NAD(P)H-dependent glycerol-3-phosphate dehydrogenase, partial [Cyanobacteria bacterium P01_A01_bin.37]
LNLGTNAKAALITRAMAEVIRVGTTLGGEPETFFGLSGLGDMLATCSSPLSRNYRVGLGLAQRIPLASILNELQGTVEGVNRPMCSLIWQIEKDCQYFCVHRQTKQVVHGNRYVSKNTLNFK